MVSGLSVSDVIRVQATLAPIAAPLRNFGIPLFIDETQGVIDISERLRQYSTIEQVLEDFDTSTGAYKGALKFFSQSPRPGLCFIGAWARQATKGWLHGGLLTPSQQLLSNFTAITSGAMSTYIDGKPLTVAGLNFASAVNLNGVASTLQTALALVSAGATVWWNSALGRFEVMSGTSGAASSVLRFTAPTAWGSASFSSQPSNNDTLTVNGTLVTFVTGSPTGSQVQIAGTLAATLTAIAAFLNESADVNISVATYSVVGTVLYGVSKITGTGGNAYTLAKVSTAITLSGSTFAGGSGTDCTAAFRLSAATNAPAPIAGVAAETPLAAATDFVEKSNDWYAMQFVSNTQPSNAEHEAVAEFIEALDPDRTYWATTQEQEALDPNDNTDLATGLKTLNLSRSCIQYSSTSPVAIASLFGRFATVNFMANKTTITGMWKIEPGIEGEVLTKTQAEALKAKNCNMFVKYNNGKFIVQWGKMANGDYIDERIGIDWLKNFIQVTLWNVLYQTPTKVPQTNEGTQMLVTPTKECCQQAVRNGLLAPGKWLGPPIGNINTGDYLEAGYYVFADVVENQAQADREERKAVPIQVAAKFAGAVHTVDVLMTFNR